MISSAIASVASLVERVIDLFDPDPERSRQKRIARALKRAGDLEKELDAIIRSIELDKSDKR